MTGFLTKLIGDKRAWKALEARADALPATYRAVYGQIKTYVFRSASGDGSAAVAALRDIVELFEDGAARGASVLEVTGHDVAAFCDARVAPAPTYLDGWRASLNRDVAAALAE